MKKKMTLILFGCLILASSAHAGTPYFRAQMGYNALEDLDLDYSFNGLSLSGDMEFDGGLFTSGAFGYDFGQVRLDAEIGYSANDGDKLSFDLLGEAGLDDTEITNTTIMANAYYDIDTNTSMTPYVGVGVGYSSLDLDTEGFSGDDDVLAYQLNIGLDIAVNQMLCLDVGYRYFATEDATFTLESQEVLEAEYSSHIVMGGVRLNF